MKNKNSFGMKIVCEKCGKNPPLLNNMTNKNWMTYDLKIPCECGGKWKQVFLFDGEDE